MRDIYKNILISVGKNEKLLAILIDPDKMQFDQVAGFIIKVNASAATHVFVGGSFVEESQMRSIVTEIRKHTILPIVIFPGDVSQISENADALLFLSLISGRNPEYLIGKQVDAVSKLRSMQLEVIPTGYLLVENGKETSVQKVTGTIPMSRINTQNIIDTAVAGELLGMQLIYLESGSGATHPIDSDIIEKVKSEVNIPLIVGGGIKNLNQLEMAYNAGADLVVIGNAFEKDESFFESIKREYH